VQVDLLDSTSLLIDEQTQFAVCLKMSAVTKKQEERRARLWASVQGREVDESVGFRSILVMEIIFL
jgi:hypothetical protein